VADFEVAWRLQERRRLGSRPSWVCSTTSATTPQKVYDEVIEFLGVPDDNKTHFRRINENGHVRVL